MENNNKFRPFGKKDVIGYIFGDMAGSFVNLTYDAFFLIFATYVLKIDPKFMSALFLGSRLWDAVNDPLIGSFPDRFRISKKDKFKPWIKIFMWPLALSIILGFMDVSAWDMTEKMKHVWVTFCYILYGMSYTGTSMPFGAMANVVTRDSNERARLSAARAIGGMTVGFGFVGLIPMIIWDANNQPSVKGYTIMSIIAAVMCIVSYTILNKFTIERYSAPEHATNTGEKYSFTKTLKEALTNRALLGIMLASIGSLIFITGNSQFGGFIFKEYYKAPKLLTLQTFLQIPVMGALFFIGPKLSAKFGKRNTLTVALIVNLIISTFLFLVPIANPKVYIVLNTIAVIGQFFFTMFVWAFVGDAIDYHEYKYKNRNDGTLYSTYTFSRKVGTTIASAGATAILASIGFVSGLDSQTVEVTNAIRMLGTGIPMVACIIELIGLRFVYHLTTEDSIKISKVLNEEA